MVSHRICTRVCCAVFCRGYIIIFIGLCDKFTHMYQVYFSSSGSVVWLHRWKKCTYISKYKFHGNMTCHRLLSNTSYELNNTFRLFNLHIHPIDRCYGKNMRSISKSNHSHNSWKSQARNRKINAIHVPSSLQLTTSYRCAQVLVYDNIVTHIWIFPKYSERIKSVSWLLTHWLRASLGRNSYYMELELALKDFAKKDFKVT